MEYEVADKPCFGLGSIKTSSTRPSTPPNAPSRSGFGAPRSLALQASPALSSTSTADEFDEETSSSPALPPLPEPSLPERAREHLRRATSPELASSSSEGDAKPYVTASWGSPYPFADGDRLQRHHYRQSFSSESSEDYPVHQLEINTPFLRAAPLITTDDEQDLQDSSSDEPLGRSLSPREREDWFEETDPLTPRPNLGAFRHRPRTRSSSETLKAAIARGSNMENFQIDTGRAGQDAASIHTLESAYSDSTSNKLETPIRTETNGSFPEHQHPTMPTMPTKPTKSVSAATSRLKKRVPWKGKNIMVHLPRDEERGQAGKGAKPLNTADVAAMLRSWKELGYSTRGFDLNGRAGPSDPLENHSQSRDAWPDPQDILRDRSQRKYQVTLPDLNTWKDYVNELQEAKLRALGVSFSDELAPATTASPAPSHLSRQMSVSGISISGQYPGMPFSPPLPPGSTSSPAMQNFPFNGPFHAPPQPPSAASPAPFNGSVPPHAKFNPRASISVSPNELPHHFSGHNSPHGWAPQNLVLQQQLGRSRSPSVLAMNPIMSPNSPFQEHAASPLGIHSRHQSLQYPLLPHQQLHRQDSARASPRLQELREVDEEVLSNPYDDKSPSKTPEPSHFVQHNASASLQKEIDDAEYHLEEQFREQLEHEDYSPHNEAEKAEARNGVDSADIALPLQTTGPSVPLGSFVNDAEGPVLHHPQPHSRGHSLSQNAFFENGEARDSTDEAGVRKPPVADLARVDEAQEIETNPSNLGTPLDPPNGVFEFGNKFHQPAFSTSSNPWVNNDTQNGSKDSSRRPSHSSKSSFSKLNANATEFKFNPKSTFTPGQFNFGAKPFQPSASTFQPSGANQPMNHGASEPVATTHFRTGSASSQSKINAAAPVFTPSSQSSLSFTNKSTFDFTANGPVFNPGAAFFQPAASTSHAGTSSVGSVPEPAFSSIDLGAPPVVGSSKSSKSVPIVPLSDEEQGGDKPKAHNTGDGRPEGEDETRTRGDTTLASTELSESTDGRVPSESNGTKATTSPSTTSPDHDQVNWPSFEFSREREIHAFGNSAPSPGEQPRTKIHKKSLSPVAEPFTSHKKSLSASAKPFVPGSGSFTFGVPNSAAVPFQPTFKTVDPPLLVDLANSEDERAASPTPVPEPQELSVETPEPQLSTKISVSSGLASSRFASPPLGGRQNTVISRFASPSPKPTNLAASPASSPSAMSEPDLPEIHDTKVAGPTGLESFHETIPMPVSPSSARCNNEDRDGEREPTFEEIDAVMQHLNKNDPTVGVNRAIESPQWHQPIVAQDADIAADTDSLRLPVLRRHAAEGSSDHSHTVETEVAAPMLSTELEDPFVDPSHSGISQSFEGPVRRLNAGETPGSDWDDAFSASEQDKLEQRVHYFDGRVVDMMVDQLEPVKKAILSLQSTLTAMNREAPSSRRDRRSTSAENQESDADDEDEDVPIGRRSMSPKRDRRLEQIRYAVLDAMSHHHAARAAQPVSLEPRLGMEDSAIIRGFEDMKNHIESLQIDFPKDDMRNLIEEAVQNRVPPPAPVVTDDEEANQKMSEMQARILELEQRLRSEQDKVEREATSRRAAEDQITDLHRSLEMAETKIEAEIMNCSVHDHRAHELEGRLKLQEDKNETEIQGRRQAEDRLSEIQRLLRISSEEEDRLRNVLDERDARIKSAEQAAGKQAMRLALLEAAQSNADRTHGDITNRLGVRDEELRLTRQQLQHWRSEAEHSTETARRQTQDFMRATEEAKHLRKLIDTLGTQLEENERIRDNWRSKFVSLQDDMAHAAREITEDSQRRTRKEQALIARQEVLDARLQAESRTRERLEAELERLEGGERAGMRAVNECKRLDNIVGELRSENHRLHQDNLRLHREHQDAREAAAAEAHRSRSAWQGDLDAAKQQFLSTRAELEEDAMRLRSQLDQVKLDADTAKVRHDMMLEGAQTTRKQAIDELTRSHQNTVEDLQVRYERQINNTNEDAQRSEQHLLERLSLSTSKAEHLQDRVAHLEERLQIAQEAAQAAAKAAKVAGASEQEANATAVAAKPTLNLHTTQIPEKVSPQALRESIMVLQEQLQAREQCIEELEQTVSRLDPDAPSKISKRDDEIVWLRELLAVRHGDLQDIIGALSANTFNRDAVRDATIRLKANLQMEEQERERALNGGSSITLPNIAATLSAASPRVAQAVGPLAAAWGNWRKSTQPAANRPNARNSPAPVRNATPSKSKASLASQNSLLSGLMTPPASDLRSTPSVGGQPTAFSQTGQRYTAEQYANRARGPSVTTRQIEKMPTATTPPSRDSDMMPGHPSTPPMAQSSGFDADASRLDDFDDAGFFDD